MSNKLTICGDLSASGNIYGTIPGANHVNTGTGDYNTWSGTGSFGSVLAAANDNTGYGYNVVPN